MEERPRHIAKRAILAGIVIALITLIPPFDRVIPLDFSIVDRYALADVGVWVYLNSHAIRFDGVDYNYAANTSTWHYTVTSGGPPAIDHWVLELCPSHQVLDAAYPGRWEVGTDPTTGIYGIKWDVGFKVGETKTFWVTLQGLWEVGFVDAAIKAGLNVYYGEVQGPSCTPLIPLEVTVTDNLTDLTITQFDLDAWFSDPDQAQQSLGSFDVTVLAAVNYRVEACYEVSPIPSPPFATGPLKIENPQGSGNWDYLSQCPSRTQLLGFSGQPNRPNGEMNTYPTEVDLSRLGDRKVGESFNFTIRVTVSEV